MTVTRSFEIRQFDAKDLFSVMEINKKCLPENYPSSFFLDMFANHPELFLVAKSEEMLAGYIMCRIEHGFSEARKFRLIRKGHVVSLGVLPEFRRNHIATTLVNSALERLGSDKVEECFLEVRVSNKTAIALYESLGFKGTRRVQYYYMDGEEAVVMCKRINPSGSP